MSKLDIVREVLTELEFAGRENAQPACAYCKAFAPIDPANPRDFERHAADCKWAAAAEATKAEPAAETADEPPVDPTPTIPSTDPAAASSAPVDPTPTP